MLTDSQAKKLKEIRKWYRSDSYDEVHGYSTKKMAQALFMRHEIYDELLECAAGPQRCRGGRFENGEWIEGVEIVDGIMSEFYSGVLENILKGHIVPSTCFPITDDDRYSPADDGEPIGGVVPWSNVGGTVDHLTCFDVIRMSHRLSRGGWVKRHEKENCDREIRKISNEYVTGMPPNTPYDRYDWRLFPGGYSDKYTESSPYKATINVKIDLLSSDESILQAVAELIKTHRANTNMSNANPKKKNLSDRGGHLSWVKNAKQYNVLSIIDIMLWGIFERHKKLVELDERGDPAKQDEVVEPVELDNLILSHLVPIGGRFVGEKNFYSTYVPAAMEALNIRRIQALWHEKD